MIKEFTLVFSSVSGSGGTGTINEPIRCNLADIVFVKVVPSIAGGPFTFEIFKIDALTAASRAYAAIAFSGTHIDPEFDNAGVREELNEGPVATYEDEDASQELHSRITNNDASTITFTVTIRIIERDNLVLRRVATAVDVQTDGESIVGVTDTSIARTVTLATADLEDGKVILVNDESGAAGTNNITIDTEGSETIDGSATLVINTNNGRARLYSDGSNWFTF